MIRIITGCILFFSIVLSSFAQPGNDNCENAVDLGVVPICSDVNEYSNLAATTSIISSSGADAPPCFNGGQADRDVWFTIDLPANVSDITIIVEGEANNPESIRQPQIALYRGACNIDQLNFLACSSSQPGSQRSRLDVFNLVGGQTYFLRINDYSQSASSNAGNFQVCVSEFTSVFNLGGDDDFTEACSGTLFDSGGPDGNYDNWENESFTICPADAHSCIVVEFESLSLEQGLDELTIYDGQDATGNIIATASALALKNDFRTAANSGCVTIRFQSDGSVVNSGFELTWSCESQSCDDSSPENPDLISQLPFQAEGINVCEDYSSIGSNACRELGPQLFLGGPDYFFSYDSDRDQCVDINVHSTLENTGVAVFLLDADAEIDRCIDASSHGMLHSVPFEEGQTYLLAVAHPSGCFRFDLDIEQTDNCILSPSLDNSLCNPINTCFDPESENLNARFFFEDLLVDFTILQDVNSGCWAQDIDPDNDDTEDANFYWFTLKAFADGNIGFFVNSVNPSDIDFNVWGPFSEELICNNPDSVKEILASSQPIRSSWAADMIPTGLADIHPITGVPVFDDYDCDFPLAGSEGDGFVRTISAKEGEHYVFLFNDFDGNVDDRGLIVDWSPMDAGSVLANDFDGLMTIDTTICSTDTFFFDFLMPNLPLNIEPDVGVSCQSCEQPFIVPADSIDSYKITLQGQCSVDTLMLQLNVLEDQLRDSSTLCNGQDLLLDVEIANSQAEYTWTGDTDSLSCTDCADPVFQSSVAGTYRLNYNIELPNCNLRDSITIIVDESEGPNYEIIEDVSVCQGSAIRLGGMDDPDNDYTWLLNDSVISNEANPEVTINISGVYLLEVSNGLCPYTTIDSVVVEMDLPPVIDLIDDITVCEGDTLVLNESTVQEDVNYNWTSSSTGNVLDPTDGRGVLVPGESGSYRLRAVRGACVVEQSVEIEVIPSSILVLPDQDTLLTCLGDTFNLEYTFSPASAMPFWVNATSGDTLNEINLELVANKSQKFYAYSESNGCPVVDSIYIRVDSLPADLSISPSDTSICEGATVILTSPDFDPALYEMVYLWTPTTGEQSGDSLYNFVITPTQTTTYSRISRTGACVDTSMATVTVRKIPTISLTPSDTTVCPGQPVQIFAEVDPPNSMLTWSGGEGLSCDDCPEPIARPTATTTYTLEAENEDCPSEMASITINVAEDTPPFIGPSDLTICEGELLALNPNEVEEFEYSWSSEDPNFDQQEVRNPIVRPPVGLTRYFVTVTDTSSECSMGMYTLDVLVPVLADLPDFIYCDSLQSLRASANFVNIGILPSDIDVQYQWSTGQSTAEITFLPFELDDNELLLSANVDGCVSQSSGSVEQVDFSADLIGSIEDRSTVLGGSMVDLRLDADIDNRDAIESLEWTVNEAPLAMNEEILNGVTIPDVDTVVFRVSVATEQGCFDTLSITYFTSIIQLPNAFSPNNDNQNDRFNIVGVEGVEEQLIIEEFKVFSRWGTLVYDNEDPRNGWDGTDGVENLPADTYKYIITVRLEESVITRQGEINLIR